jgi:hypothetical protein
VGLYWVIGQLNRGPTVDPAITLGSRTAVFYVSGSDPISGNYRLTTITAANGAFVINPLLNREIPIDYSTNFYSAAVMRTFDTYGASPESITLNEQGYKTVTLTLLNGAGPGGPVALSDTGWVRNTNIRKVGNDIELSWGFDPALPATAVKIFVEEGADAEYQANPSLFTRELASIAIGGATTYTHPDAAAPATNSNYYYRIVPFPFSIGTDVLGEANNSITVGKVKFDLPANKYVFCGLPFQEDGISLISILGDQIGNDGEFNWWDGVANPGGTYSGGRWGGYDRNLSLGEGFYVRAKSDKNLVLVGRFGRLASTATRHLTGGRYSLIAYPYPTAKAIGSMGVVPDSDATLLKWYVDASTPHTPPLTQAHDGATYSAGRWVGPADVPSFELARPRMYKPSGDFDWGISFP